MRQANVDPDSLELKLKEAVVAVVGLLGPEAMVVSGAVASAGGGGVVVSSAGGSVGAGAGGLVGRGRRRWDLGRSPIRW
jgi:hypothetical protein